MNSSSYKEFNRACKDIITEKKQKTPFVLNGNPILLKELSLDIKQAKKHIFSIKQKLLTQIDKNCLKFEETFKKNGGRFFWAINSENALSILKEILIENKLDTVFFEKSLLLEEMELENFLDNEEIKNEPNADAFIFQPNQLLVESGSIVISTSEKEFYNNVLLSKIKICFASIDNFLQSSDDLDIFLNMYSIYKSNEKMGTYSIILNPNKKGLGDLFYLILIDNKRTSLLSKKEHYKTLTCIQCNACKKVCPVYNTIGDEPYNNAFAGPLAKVILPFIDNVETTKHICFASVLCGSCTEICPSDIPLHDLIIKNRRIIRSEGSIDVDEDIKLRQLSKFLKSRKRMNYRAWYKNFFFKWFLGKEFYQNKRKITLFKKQVFNKYYQKNS